MQKRDELQSRTAEIYKAAPSTNSKSYSSAQKALKENEEQFFRSSEIDQMLPEHLREGDETSKSWGNLDPCFSGFSVVWL